MNLDIGTTYAFSFLPAFDALDGVYRVRAETTFEDSISSGVDFVRNLYIPAGLTDTDFKNDYINYKVDKVSVLESVVDSSIIYYTPESIFRTIPDPTIQEYYNLNLIVKLGAFKNVQDVLPLIQTLQDTIGSEIGVTDKIIVTTNSNKKIYLTQLQYQTLVDERNANINRAESLAVRLRNEQNLRLLLASKVAEYEALIAQLVTP